MAGKELLWAEIEQPQLAPFEPIPSELKKFLIQKSQKVEPLKVHQPWEEDKSEFLPVPPECSKMNDVVIHTVKLIQYSRKLDNLIDRVEKKTDTDRPSSPVPALPQLPETTEKHSLTYPFRYMERTYSDFSEGKGGAPPRLNANCAKWILRKSVATILAHIGYDAALETSLDVLIDVAEDYIHQFAKLIQIAFDQVKMMEPIGFPDIMEKVFYEMGIGSMTKLHDFYQLRILQYHKRVLNSCIQLKEKYENLATPINQPVSEGEIIRCGQSDADNEEDIPEIHFPALGEGYSADELQPSLEPGFQMLHSLEQEEQLQNLEAEDEININELPSQESVPRLAAADTSQQVSAAITSKSRKKKKKSVH